MLLPFGLQIIYLKILLVIFIVELSLKLYKENFVMWRKFCAVVLMAALLVSCGCVASADGSAPAEYIFDFTDSKWVSENVVNDEYNDTISYGETPSVLAGNSETSFSYTCLWKKLFLGNSAFPGDTRRQICKADRAPQIGCVQGAISLGIR